MASYVGKSGSPKSVVEAIARVREGFVPSRHAEFATEAKTFLAAGAGYEKLEKAVDGPAAKEEAAAQALADADAARDLAVVALDRKLIAQGENKLNSFKRFGLPSISKVIGAAYDDETRLVEKLAKAAAKRAPKECAELGERNAAVKAAQAKLDAARAVANKARLKRDTEERRVRAALAILKLRVRLAEKLGAPGVYDELFAVEAAPKKKKKPVAPPPAP
jgi:hypothetical protein